MAINGLDIGTIEAGLKEALEAHARARTRGDFYENVFSVHTPLDDALDWRLIERGEPVQDLAFTQKFEKLLPELYRACPVPQLNSQRNQLGHPRKRCEDRFVYDTSVGLVDLAVAAWPGLFAHAAPRVTHPAFPTAAQVQAAAAPAYRPARPAQVMSTAPTPVAPAPARASSGKRVALVYVALLVMVLVLGAFLIGRQNAPRDPAHLAVGGKALVSVPPGDVILLNAAPGISKPQAAHFADGTVLDLTAGPIIADDLTWWKVRGKNGEGWTVADYLKPVAGR